MISVTAIAYYNDNIQGCFPAFMRRDVKPSGVMKNRWGENVFIAIFLSLYDFFSKRK